MSDPKAADAKKLTKDPSFGHKATLGNKLFHLFSPFTIILANVSIWDRPRPERIQQEKTIPTPKNETKIDSYFLLKLGSNSKSKNSLDSGSRYVTKSTESHRFLLLIFSFTPTYILTVMFLLFLSVIPFRVNGQFGRFFRKAGADACLMFSLSRSPFEETPTKCQSDHLMVRC